MFWSNPNYFYQDTINQIFISTRLLKNYNIWLHYCKTLQYLLYKTNIENRSPLISFKSMQQVNWEFLPEIGDIPHFRKWY